MIILVIYYLICCICTLFSAPNRDEEQEDYSRMGGWRRAVIVVCGRFLSRVMFFVFGFYWISETYRILGAQRENSSSSENEVKEQSEEPERPLIFGHFVLHVCFFSNLCCQVAGLPLVGLISKCLGCVYVQRESKASYFKGVAGVTTERVREAYQDKSTPMMMLFLEGTTTNIDFLLPFKTGAFLAGASVLPVILRYPYERFSPAWDSISGTRHVLFLLCQFVNHMEVTRLPVYYPPQEEKDDPKQYAENVRRLMAREVNLILSDIGLAENRIYHAALNGNNSLPSVLHQKDD